MTSAETQHLVTSSPFAVLESAADPLSASGSLAYVFCPKQTSHWSPFSKSVDRSVHSRLYGFRQRLHNGQQHLQSYLLPGGGAVVECGVREVAGELHHVQPLIYRSSAAIIILYGFLSHVDELVKRLEAETREGLDIPRSPYARSSVLGVNSQSHHEAAEALLEVYLQTRANDLLIMLSELQGQYAFMIYDSSKKQIFAARDPGGQQPLFYSLDADGSVSLTNKPVNVPGAETAADWQEVPPGHYVAGKTPRLHQFALTPEQLLARQYHDALEDELCPEHAIAIPHKHKTAPSHSLYTSNSCAAESSSVFSLNI